MMFDVGSAILVPEEEQVQRLTRLEDVEGIMSIWYQAMTGDRTEKGPVPLSALRTGVSKPARHGF
jgi:hypothetical protein